MDSKPFVDALLTGTPWAILVAIVGIIWQATYTRSRDKFNDEQSRRTLKLEEQKFEYQKELEKLRFEYERRRWREELGREIALKHIEIRSDEYAEIWSQVESIASHRLQADELSRESVQRLAENIKKWRYSKAGLIAEETTRDAAMALQKAAWEYDGSALGYRRMRQARALFRNAMRADLAIGENVQGLTIYEITEQRSKIQKELKTLQEELGISGENQTRCEKPTKN